MEINHRIQFVEGAFDTDKQELICVGSQKYGEVKLCFRANMHVPFAKIKLYTRDLAVEADAVFDDAYKLGNEIARRWNAFNNLETQKEES